MFAIRAMTAEDASAIAAWHYPEPYDFYDWERDAGDLGELLDPGEWGRRALHARGRRLNRRAIAVYERAGFTVTERFVHHTNGADHEFLRMES